MQTRFSRLSHHLYVHHGHVNTGILRDGDHALLIDPSGTTLCTTLAELGITDVGQILFTHHHRDSTAGFPMSDNVRVGVPAKEAAWFSEVETFWKRSTISMASLQLSSAQSHARQRYPCDGYVC